jgi:hypothetical protein
MARLTANQKMHRVLTFMAGMRYASVVAAMATRGYDDEAYANGTRLLMAMTDPTLMIDDPTTPMLDAAGPSLAVESGSPTELAPIDGWQSTIPSFGMKVPSDRYAIGPWCGRVMPSKASSPGHR